MMIECAFCQLSMYKVAKWVNWFYCSNCKPIVRIYVQDNMPVYSYFEIEHKEKTYRFNFMLVDKKFTLSQSDGSILELDYLPLLNPQNALQKLPILLNFS
jgi:hypothetical protein